ncbi:CRE-IFP-1 protein [Caenorhabditis remanei]|uniref:CRE-IFP-1 protein n=1 Tax=Caenorhabditis remanei TaxID=31234 RepID=E3MB07_CAERE|nr:CRE-IFP-1 protein [Caenorhabditis remanei]
MNSANARDCLLHLSRAKLSEREDLVQLNDKFVDIIEHVHYMEAEHAALEHDYNLLKSGVQSDSSGINEIYELEIRNVRSGIEDINRNRQQLLNEQSHLSQQVKEAEQQWRHTAKAALGVPKEVDDDFARICQIKYEDCLTKRRIKYMEDKNRLLKQNSGRIFEQINLMRMRTDQAVSLQQEYLVRKNELLNSIRNMEEDNKRIIMNEHKYFTRDRNADRHVFRDQLRQSIADIRNDYEFKRVRNEEEIRVRLEREIARINVSQPITFTTDKLKGELTIVKTNCHELQQQVSNIEIRNSTLSQQIELLRLEIGENYQSFDISLDSKTKEIEKLREQCTSISVELEKLCDLNIDLEKEIAVYRRLLDQSGNPTAHTGSTQVIARALNRNNTEFTSHRSSVRSESTVESVVDRTPHRVDYRYQAPPSHQAPTQPIQPILAPIPPVQPIQSNQSNQYIRETVDYGRDRSYSPYRSDSRSHSHSRNSVIDTYTSPSYAYPAVPITQAPPTPQPLPPVPTIPLPPIPTTDYDRSRLTTYESQTIRSRDGSIHRTPSPGLRRTYDTIASYEPYSTTRTDIDTSRPVVGTIGQTHASATGASVTGSQTGIGHGTTIRDERVTTNFPPIRPISETIGYDSIYNRGTEHRSHYGHHHQASNSVSSSAVDTRVDINHYSPTPRTVRPEAARPYQNGQIEDVSSFDSVDEDNFQRFTRWYKGRVKISDVTPDFVQLVNRSSKKSADIGGFKLIHEFGQKSVYVDLPASLILAPKESLKIYARSATHERGAVVAEIDLFDTTIHTNTSIRNTNNEVKSWFVYTSNTEIGDPEHHHH